MSFIDRKEIGKSMYDVLTDPATSIFEIIRPAALPNLTIAPARIALAKVESKLLGELEADGVVAEIIFPNTIPPFFPRGGLTATAPSAWMRCAWRRWWPPCRRM